MIATFIDRSCLLLDCDTDPSRSIAAQQSRRD